MTKRDHGASQRNGTTTFTFQGYMLLRSLLGDISHFGKRPEKYHPLPLPECSFSALPGST